MQECTFEPELIAAFKAAKGRALEAAMHASHTSRNASTHTLSSSQASFRGDGDQRPHAQVCCLPTAD